MTARSFESFYGQFGFSEYPFSSFTSEHEKERGKDLFVSTSMYGPLIESFRNGRTMIMAGDRGSGKTAIVYDLTRRVGDLSKSLIVNVSDFSSLKIEYDHIDLYRFLISRMTNCLFSRLIEDQKTGNGLRSHEKLALSWYLHHFGTASTKDELRKFIANLQVGALAKVANFAYRVLRLPINVAANATSNFVSGIIAKSVGNLHFDAQWSEYFPELKISVDESFSNEEASYRVLSRLTELARKLGYERVVLMIDKVDEDPRLRNAAEEIADFVAPLVTDNKFLLDENYQIVVALWVIPYDMLKEQVRTQKIYCPLVQWSRDDLLAAADRRVQVFSGGKVSKLKDIVADEVEDLELEELIALSNKNPRDFWHILDKVMRAQFEVSVESRKITSAAIRRGMDEFVRSFNFYEYYPRKSNARANSMDVYGYIRHLLKLPAVEFTRNLLDDKARTGSSTQNYVSQMESIGLVERIGTEGGAILFRIRDPKVRRAIEHNIEIARAS